MVKKQEVKMLVKKASVPVIQAGGLDTEDMPDSSLEE